MKTQIIFRVAVTTSLWLAAGRTDGYWEFGLKPWDVAAGKVIVEEAGGKVSDFSGRPWRVGPELGSETLAANGRVHAQMLKIIRRRFWVIITFFVMTVVGVTVWTYLQIPVYRATTTVMIGIPAETTSPGS